MLKKSFYVGVVYSLLSVQKLCAAPWWVKCCLGWLFLFSPGGSANEVQSKMEGMNAGRLLYERNLDAGRFKAGAQVMAFYQQECENNKKYQGLFDQMYQEDFLQFDDLDLKLNAGEFDCALFKEGVQRRRIHSRQQAPMNTAADVYFFYESLQKEHKAVLATVDRGRLSTLLLRAMLDNWDERSISDTDCDSLERLRFLKRGSSSPSSWGIGPGLYSTTGDSLTFNTKMIYYLDLELDRHLQGNGSDDQIMTPLRNMILEEVKKDHGDNKELFRRWRTHHEKQE